MPLCSEAALSAAEKCLCGEDYLRKETGPGRSGWLRKELAEAQEAGQNRGFESVPSTV